MNVYPLTPYTCIWDIGLAFDTFSRLDWHNWPPFKLFWAKRRALCHFKGVIIGKDEILALPGNYFMAIAKSAW